MSKKTNVFMDENGDYCVITGTTDRKEAEKALRDAEIEWYGENHQEKPLNFEEFALADIYYGSHKSEETYYWGKEPNKFFDGKYETEEGFVGVNDF